MRAFIIASVLLMVGCFSQDDFGDCVAPGQCGVGSDGRGLLCVDGQCVAPAIDGEGDDIITLSGRLGDVHSHPERTVVISDVEVANLNLRVEADVIILTGSITGDGGGFTGGEGGRNGAVGMSGEPGDRGEPDRQDAEAGGPGGEPGTERAEPGGAGGGGVYQESEPCRIGFNFVLAGSGGGGGGGGAGGACRGSRGGAGGSGGAAVLLRATRFIELRGPISVRGADGQGPEERVCGDSGLGGPGGGGAGGLVYLEAPTVLYSQGAAIDVSGAPGAGGGLVTVFGTVEGVYRAPAGIDDDRVCQVPLAQ